MVDIRWLYYVVDDAWVARVDAAGTKAQLLEPGGTWSTLDDVWKVCVDGRQVKTKAEALEEARELFEARGKAHTLGPSTKPKP